MKKQWYVYRNDGTKSGPYEAADIRESLRNGRVDPFDQVCQVGSTLKVEILDVDEIFLDIEYLEPEIRQEKKDSVYGAPRATKYDSTNGSEPIPTRSFDDNMGSTQVSQRSTVLSEKSYNSSTGQIVTRPLQVHDPRKEKKYFLIGARKRVLGPLSSDEIKRMFYKGVLDNTTLVQRKGSNRKILVQKFISMYYGDNNKNFKSDHTRILLNKNRKKKFKLPWNDSLIAAVIGLSCLFLLLVGAGFLFYKSFMVKDDNRPAINDQNFDSASNNYRYQDIDSSTQKNLNLINQKIREQELARRNAVNNSNKDNGKNQNNSKSQNKKDLSVNKKNTQSKRSQQPERMEASNRYPSSSVYNNYSNYNNRNANLPKRSTTSMSKNTKSAMNSKLPRKGPATTVATVAPQHRASNTKTSTPKATPTAPKVAAVSKPAAQASLDFNKMDGQIITLSGMRFQKGQLDSCPVKCTLEFSGPRGNIRGIFFKSAYSDRLSSTNGTVTITGRVGKQGSGYVLYVQGVY